jgi:hypothetical protein
VETMKLTEQQDRRIRALPADYRIVGVDRSAPFVRTPTGQLMRIERDGRVTTATVAAERSLAEGEVDRSVSEGVKATTPYTSVME